jgi:hypothetical protein
MGGHGGGMGGGMRGGGWGGGMGGAMHGGGWGGGMHAGGIAGRASFAAIGGGPHFAGMGVGPHFSGTRFAGAPVAHGAFGPRFSRFGFHGRGRFHHRFAFFGGPFFYADYSSCWGRVWTPYGPQWADLCGDYGYY